MSARAWSRSVVAAVTCAALVSAGCGQAWAPAAAVAAPQMVTGEIAPRVIDVLPLDVEVWSQDGGDNTDALRTDAEGALLGAVTTTFFARGVQVGAQLDWDGRYLARDGRAQDALAPTELLATINSLARYGERIPAPPAELPVPYLPARLGTRSGADATLYVGGWGFAGQRAKTRGEKVVKGVEIGLIVLFAVVIIAAVVAGGKGGGGGGLGNVAGAAVNGAGHVAVSAGRVALQMGSASVQLGKAFVQADLESNGAIDQIVIDAMGNAHSVADANAMGQHPEWARDGLLPHQGHSQMFVEMTLVDNHTGLVLWHAQQRAPADIRRAGDVDRVARTLLASFPAVAAR